MLQGLRWFKDTLGRVFMCWGLDEGSGEPAVWFSLEGYP